ncbi:hypothetical protein SAMN05518866_13924 [Sphingobium sp. YR768]|nr:hypothetical protein SAMN05518866_13924 [Sphingobium sp. YR768]
MSRMPTDLFEAVIHNFGIEVRCICGHAVVFAANGLWWSFYVKRWPYRFSEARRRFCCTRCARSFGQRVRPDYLDATSLTPTIILPMPDEREWKRMIQSMRG